MKRRRKIRCLVCESLAVCRGLCDADYQSAKRRIRLGQVTEQFLVDQGLLLPKHATPRSEFGERLADAIKRTTKAKPRCV